MSVVDPSVHPSFWNGMNARLYTHTHNSNVGTALVHTLTHTYTEKGTLTIPTNEQTYDDDDVMKYFVAMNFYAIKLLHQIHHTHFVFGSLSTHLMRVARALLYAYYYYCYYYYI